MPALSPRSATFRNAISDFIDARKEAKLNGKDDADVEAKYEYAAWLGEAARRVSQIQAVTHVLKATHPDAKGTSLHVQPQQLPDHPVIGSHSLGDHFADDVVGNAAALDVFKFLKIQVEDRPLLHWMRAGDVDLLAALADDSETAQAWMNAFASLVREGHQPISHPLAKQIYWLTGDEPTEDKQYHLLQPLFASSLAQVVHAEIQDALFGEANKLARQARRERKAHHSAYRDYRGLVVRKLGGTKPQNVSQLNSERRGQNYLLDSSPPPDWTRDRSFRLYFTDSALYAFRRFDDVDQILKTLQNFMKANPPANLETRKRRESLDKALGQQLAEFGAAVRGSHSPGWTRDQRCRLPLCEQLWLDSERIELPIRPDEEGEQDVLFAQKFAEGDWADEVARRFGAWVIDYFRKAGITTIGDSELRHWSRLAIIDAQWPMPIQRRALGGTA